MFDYKLFSNKFTISLKKFTELVKIDSGNEFLKKLRIIDSLEFISRKRKDVPRGILKTKYSGELKYYPIVNHQFSLKMQNKFNEKTNNLKNLNLYEITNFTEFIIGTIYRPIKKINLSNLYNKHNFYFFWGFEKNKIVFFRKAVNKINRNEISYLNKIYNKRFLWDNFSKLNKKQKIKKFIHRNLFSIGFRQDLLWSNLKNQI